MLIGDKPSMSVETDCDEEGNKTGNRNGIKSSNGYNQFNLRFECIQIEQNRIVRDGRQNEREGQRSVCQFQLQ
jgi:hypothetical protein